MRNKNIINILKKFIIQVVTLSAVVALSFSPHILYALTLTGNQYKLENPTFTTGGGNKSSAGTYSVQDSSGPQGGPNSSSTNYQVQPGSVKPLLPGVPGIPTLTNTGGTMYSTLDFVILTGGNSASDMQYAVAISSDNFTTTNFVKADDTIGTTTEVWQTYANWGSGSGERLVLLSPNTTYYIKVKARLGVGNESGYSNVTSASTVNPSLTMVVGLVSSGAVVNSGSGTTTTTVTTTPATVPFGTLQTGGIKIGAQTVTVSTNAVSGYSTLVYQDGALRKTNGTTIPPLTATNASPAAWPLSITDARFGYHTTDSTLCTGTAGRFNAADTYAALTTTPTEVACSGAQVTNEVTTLIYKVEIEGLQPPGNYQNKISYITSAQY